MKTQTLAALLCAAALPAYAAGPDIKPGQYQYTVKTEMPGLPFALPPTSFSQCVTQKDIDEGKAYQKGNKGDCKTENVKETKSSVSYDFNCSGSTPTTGHYDLTFTAEGFSGKGTMNIGGKVANTQMDAKRTGDCK